MYENSFGGEQWIHTCKICGLTEFAGNAQLPEKIASAVVFVADGGFGDGSHPSYPLGDYGKALETLGERGGMVVLVGACTIHANLKYKFGNRHFWAEGYYVSTVGLNEATIRKYIREQETHDQMMDKITTKELEDPFKGPAK